MFIPSPDNLRVSCRKIFIKNLQLPCRIGAYANERHQPQNVCFNADVWVKLSHSSSKNDALEDVLNYDCFTKIIREEALAGHVDLQETLADRIADRLVKIPGVELVRLTTEKTQAYADAESVGIEIWRSPSSITH